MTMQNPTRRAALSAIAAAPVISSAAVASATASPIVLDPVFAARDAWKEAERAYMDAEHRAGIAAGDQCVTIPTATGGERRISTAEGINKAISEEYRRTVAYCANWTRKVPDDIAALTDAERAAAKAWTRPDAEALKADLADRQARKVAAMKAEDVEALDRADRDALRAYLDTPATTTAGIALKLRDAEYREGDEVSAALADLDRMAGQGAA